MEPTGSTDEGIQMPAADTERAPARSINFDPVIDAGDIGAGSPADLQKLDMTLEFPGRGCSEPLGIASANERDPGDGRLKRKVLRE